MGIHWWPEKEPRPCKYCDRPASYVPGVGEVCEECTASIAAADADREMGLWQGEDYGNK